MPKYDYFNQFFKKSLSLGNAISKGPIFLFPNFNLNFFYFTIIISLFFTVLFSPITGIINIDTFKLVLNPSIIKQIELINEKWFLDPLIIQFISLIILTIIIFYIIKNHESSMNLKNNYFLLLFPWFLILFSYLIVEVVFKPSFNYSRPDAYLIQNETIFVRLFHSQFGAGQSAPSGFVVRQVCLALLSLLIISHPNSPLSNKIILRILLEFLFLSFIVLVAIQRFFIEAHSIFDIIFAIGCGTLIFWLCYVIPYDIFHKNGTLNKVLSVFFLAVGIFIFYSRDPIRWLISSSLLVIFLLILDILPSIFDWLKNNSE